MRGALAVSCLLLWRIKGPQSNIVPNWEEITANELLRCNKVTSVRYDETEQYTGETTVYRYYH